VGLLPEDIAVRDFSPLERFDEGPSPTISFEESVTKCNQAYENILFSDWLFC
jgi:hypothetical protein